MPPSPPSRSLGLTAAAVLAVLLAAYAPAFTFPFAHDDWEKLRWHDRHTDWGERLATYFNPQDRLFYRPLSSLAAGLLHAGWPDDPRAYHVVNLLLLATAALAAGALVHTLTGQARTGRLVALLFAAATPVHLETQFWMVGVNDLAMVPLVFAALRLHLRGSPGQAALTWLAALLFKESALFVPAVAAAATLLRLDAAPPAPPRARWLRLWPFVAVGLLYLALKLAGTLPTRVPADHPYAIEIARSTVGPRVGDYARWLLQGLLPALAGWAAWDRLLQAVAAHPLPLHALVWGALAGTLFVARRRDRTQLARAALAWLWILCSLGPLLLLPNQAARYYLMTALPAALWILLLAVESLSPPAGALPRARPRAAWLALFIGLSTAGGVAYARARTAEGLAQRFTDGTNHPIARGTATRIVQAQVRTLWPQLPPAAFVVFEDLDVYGFGPVAGLRRWYGDPTLIACPDGPLRGQPALLAQAVTARTEGRLRVARWDGERLRDVTAGWAP